MFIKLYTELKVQYTEQYTLLGVSKSFTAGLVEDFFFKNTGVFGRSHDADLSITELTAHSSD